MTDQIIAEHRALKSMFSRVQQEFDRPIVCTRVLHAMLTHALAEILSHCEREEQEGFFDQVVAQLPESQPQVAQLIEQHGELSQRLGTIIGQLAHSTEETLFDISREFDAFLTDYAKHEFRENQLARRAFNDRQPGL